MLIQHIALVPETDQHDLSQLARVSAALQKQVLRDVLPIWRVGASVDPFTRFEDVPAGYWPIVVTHRELGGNAGVHVDRNGQPFAQVQAAGSWSLDASRACLELLLNPFENRTQGARSLRPDQGTVEYLVEVSAPCAGARNGYAIDDVLVSDFCTPSFFAPRPLRNERYSFNDSVGSPLQLLPGGHLTWFDPTTSSWWLRSHRGPNPIDTELGDVNRRVVSLRELVQACAPQPFTREEPRQVAAQAHAQRIRQAARQRARRLRAELEREAERERATEVDVEELGVPSVPPPFPHAAATHAGAVRPPHVAVSSAARARTRNTGALIAGSALAGAAVVAFGFAARVPLSTPRDAERAATAAVVALPAPAAPTPAVQAPVVQAPAPSAAAAAPAAAPITAPVPAPQAKPVERPQPIATSARVPRRPRALPSPAPVEAPADTPAVDDSLEALIGTRR
jgi:hypothetical protein